MLQAALRDGSANRQVTCEVFGRRLPNERRYGVVAGTERVLRACPQLRDLDDATMDVLARWRRRLSREGLAHGIGFGGVEEFEILYPEASPADAAALEEAGYVADKAYDGEEGGYLGESEPYDAIILDMGLPKADGVTEDSLLEVVLDAGAEEVNDLGEAFEIVSEAADFVEVRKAIQEAGIDYESAEASFKPSVEVPLDADGARKMIRVVEALEDSDDVQDVYANGDIPDDVVAQLDED